MKHTSHKTHEQRHNYSQGFLTFKSIITLLILGVGMLSIFFLFKKAPTTAPSDTQIERITSVKVTTLNNTNKNIPIKVSGIVEAADLRNIPSNVSGTILSKSKQLEDGQFIKKGSLLLKVDNAMFEPELNQLQAQLITAQSTYRTAQLTTKNNNEALREMGIKGTSNPPQLIEAQAQITAIKRQINSIRKRKSKSSMYAPYNAKILKSLVNQGDLISPGMPIAQSHSSEQVIVRFVLNDNELNILDEKRFHKGKNMSITVSQASSTNSWQGIIKQWEKGSNLNNQFNYLIAEIENPFSSEAIKQNITIGDTVTTTINSPALSNLLIVNSEYIKNGNQVWTYNKGRLSIKNVTIKYKDKDHVYILAGLKSNDAIITSNIHLPVEGMKLKIIK